MKLPTRLHDYVTGKAPSLGHARSGHWPTVRKHFLESHPTCAVCGGKEKLEVHHLKPFHTHPSLELDPNNFITLCESEKNGVNCHLLFGHLGNFKAINSNVMDDSKIWLERISTRSFNLDKE
jgi:5-methylcytosine-specific restriction enzyme A